MTIDIFPGDDDQYDENFSEPPEDDEEIAEMWRELRRTLEKADKAPDESADHDELMSNPDFQRAYNRCIDKEIDSDAATVYARLRAFGKEHARDLYGYERVRVVCKRVED